MGFWKDVDRSLGQFIDFEPDAYRAEIADLDEEQLRSLHKRIQRKLVSAGAQTGVGLGAAGSTGGISLFGSAIGGRRLIVNSQRCEIIEARLQEKGWSGHDLKVKDLACGAAPSIITFGLAPGADHAVNAAVTHITTMATHHGADQAANYAATGVCQNTAQYAGTAATMVATHQGTAAAMAAAHTATHAAINSGTNYGLNEHGYNTSRKPSVAPVE
jgi:hypothetical protein